MSLMKHTFLTCHRNFSTRSRKFIPRHLLDDEIEVVSKPDRKYPYVVYTCGRAETGALGQRFKKKAENIKYPNPLFAPESTKITDVAAGIGFSILSAESADGRPELYGCGLNSDCQLGLHFDKMKKVKEFVDLPSKIPLPEFGKDEKILGISAGRAHSLVLASTGLFSFGNNSFGQCGRPIIKDEDYSTSGFIDTKTTIDGQKLKSVCCGMDHSLVVSEKGRVFSCGWGTDGQTGLGHFETQSEWTMVKGDIENENIVKVASKVDCALAINDKGDLFGWGNSEYGQLLNPPDEQQISSPINLKWEGIPKIVDIAAGGSFCAALGANGQVYVWGYGILGKGPNVQAVSIPTAIPESLFGKDNYHPDSRVVSINCGISHLAAISNKGDIYIWGKNRSGCLGLGDLKDQYFPLKVFVGGTALKVSCGFDHTMILAKTLL